jgi:hypothetical protein
MTSSTFYKENFSCTQYAIKENSVATEKNSVASCNHGATEELSVATMVEPKNFQLQPWCN